LYGFVFSLLKTKGCARGTVVLLPFSLAGLPGSGRSGFSIARNSRITAAASARVDLWPSSPKPLTSIDVTRSMNAAGGAALWPGETGGRAHSFPSA
jgi:hypothetical protein